MNGISKSDLETGMIVRCRNGREYTVNLSAQKFENPSGAYNRMDGYNDDLTSCGPDAFRQWDIVSVIRPKANRITSRAHRNFDPWECCGQDAYCKRGCHEDGGCGKGCIVPKIYFALAEIEDAEEAVTPKRKEGNPLAKYTQLRALDQIVKSGKEVTVITINGFQLRGTIAGHDDETVLLQADTKQHLIYKHAVSTIVPSPTIDLKSGGDEI
jgi:Uncharacterized host factor I protein